MSDSLLALKSAIERLSACETIANSGEARRTFLDFRAALTRGEVRAAEKVNGHWAVNTWVKQGILLGFRLGELQEMSDGDVLSFAMVAGLFFVIAMRFSASQPRARTK